MKLRDRESVVVTGILTVLMVAWLGFFLHRSPRFAGSGLGAAFGIAAAVCMLVPLAYTSAKRFAWFGARIKSLASMKTLLDLHVYAGLLGALLALVHTGHKFQSTMGIVLMGLLLLVVVSGYAVRYLLAFVALEMKDSLALLQTARGDLDHAWGVVEQTPAQVQAPAKWPLVAAGMASLGLELRVAEPVREVTRIAESVADLEHSVRMNETLKRWFGYSLKLHITFSVFFYVLLVLHITAGIQYGLRWLA